MTQPGDQVRVEPGDLRGKAVDLSTVTTDVSATPTAPCAFTFVQSATAQIVAGANTLQSYVAAGNAEAERLAAVLKEAAGTYEKVDERTRYALDHDPPLPVPTDPVPVNPLLPPSVPPITQPPLMAAMNGGDTGGYWTRRPRHSSFTRATPVRCGHTLTMPETSRADCAHAPMLSHSLG